MSNSQNGHLLKWVLSVLSSLTFQLANIRGMGKASRKCFNETQRHGSVDNFSFIHPNGIITEKKRTFNLLKIDKMPNFCACICVRRYVSEKASFWQGVCRFIQLDLSILRCLFIMITINRDLYYWYVVARRKLELFSTGEVGTDLWILSSWNTSARSPSLQSRVSGATSTEVGDASVAYLIGQFAIYI